jgi:hypothetical protein
MTDRPRDLFALKPNIFSWLRDRAYDLVYHEGGAILDFVGDLIRGPSGYTQSLERQTRKAETRLKPEKPLSARETQAFAAMLRRQEGEEQIAYWKRKKALLRHPDKRALLRQAAADRKAEEARQAGSMVIEASGQSDTLSRARKASRHPARGRR